MMSEGFLLGYATLSLLIFVLGLAGRFSAFTGALALGLSIVIGIAIHRSGTTNSEADRLPPKSYLWVVFAISLFYAVFSSWVPPFQTDDLTYHLLVPKRLAATGALVSDPWNLQSNMPMIFELPLALTHLSGISVAPFIVNALVLAALLFLFARESARSSTPVWMVTLTMLAFAVWPIVFRAMFSSYVELFLTLAVAVTLIHLSRVQLDENGKSRSWYIACSAAGISAGVKYPGILLVAFLLVFGIWIVRLSKRQWIIGFALAMVFALPWYLRNFLSFRNPVYPYFADWFPSPDLSQERFMFSVAMMEVHGYGKSILDYLLLPFRIFFPAIANDPTPFTGFDGYLPIVSVFSFRAMVRPGGLATSLLGCIFLVAWCIGSQQTRFLLPFIAIASSVGIADMARYRRIIAIFLSVTILQNAYGVWAFGQEKELWSLFSGNISREEFLKHRQPFSYGAAMEVNSILSPNAVLWTIGNFGRNYYFDQSTVAVTYKETEPLELAFSNPQNFCTLDRFVRRSGVEYLLINWKVFVEATVSLGDSTREHIREGISKNSTNIRSWGDTDLRLIKITDVCPNINDDA